MKIIRGIFYILFFYFLGEAISYLIKGFIPGNIIGMILLFFSLHFKIITPDKVKGVANVLVENMIVFFIPAGAGLLTTYGLISRFWFSIVVMSAVSVILVLISVSLVQQAFEKHRK